MCPACQKARREAHQVYVRRDGNLFIAWDDVTIVYGNGDNAEEALICYAASLREDYDLAQRQPGWADTTVDVDARFKWLFPRVKCWLRRVWWAVTHA